MKVTGIWEAAESKVGQERFRDQRHTYYVGWLIYKTNPIRARFRGEDAEMDHHKLPAVYNLVFLKGYVGVCVQSLNYAHVKNFKAGVKPMYRVTPPKIHMNP